LSRAGVSLAYTQGFSPRPKIGFGVPLAVGHLSETEYADVTVAEPIAPQRFAALLNEVLPEGLYVQWAGRVPPGSASVSASVTEMEYRVSVPWSVIPDGAQAKGQLESGLERFRGADRLVIERERKGKIQQFDLKQQVPMLELRYGAEAVEATMRIGVRQTGFPKPEEVLHAVFSLKDEQTKRASITRTDVGLRSTSRRGKGASGARYES
jgi:radical SAM-linked protein